MQEFDLNDFHDDPLIARQVKRAQAEEAREDEDDDEWVMNDIMDCYHDVYEFSCGVVGHLGRELASCFDASSHGR